MHFLKFYVKRSSKNEFTQEPCNPSYTSVSLEIFRHVVRETKYLPFSIYHRTHGAGDSALKQYINR
jgi:hypothetical protein